MKKSFEYIFNKYKIIDDIIIHLEKDWFFLESAFLNKWIKEKKPNSVMQYELYINSTASFFRIKKLLTKYLQKYWLFDSINSFNN